MSADVEAIRDFLVAEGLAGGSTGWKISLLSSQDAPDQEVTIYPTGGTAPEQDTSRRWRRPSFQIVTRAERDDSKASSDKAVAILAAMDRETSITGLGIMHATQSAPFALGPDPEGRPRFSINFRALET